MQAVADRPHHVFFLGGLEDVIVLVVARDQLQIAVAARSRVIIGLVEQEELEFSGHEGLHAHRLEPLDLLLEDGARRMRHFLMRVMVDHVAKHQRRALKPRNAAQRRQIGLHGVVAIALFP